MNFNKYKTLKHIHLSESKKLMISDPISPYDVHYYELKILK